MYLLKLETIPISKLRAAKYNPRKDLKPNDKEYEKIKRSINEFGYIDPVIWNKQTGNVVGGHQRLKILIEQGASEVECVVVDFDEVKEKLANIALNKISGDWEFSALADLILDLDTINADLSVTGFDEAEIQDIMGWTPDGIKTPEQDDFIPEPPKEAITKTGDIWLLGKHRVMCGDSTKIEDVERLMDGKKCSLYLTDPPYAVDYVSKARDMNKLGYVHSRATLRSAISGDGIEAGQEEDLWRDVFVLSKEIALADNAAWYVWHDCRRAMLAMCNLLVELGLLFHQTIVWRKNNFVIGRCDYQANSEACFYGWVKGNRPPFYGAKNQTTVWDISRDTQKPDHPTQKPVDLFVIPIENHTTKDELVYDSFIGSGSTLIACEKTNRVCYGMEIDPVYCDVIVKRWEEYAGKKAELLSDENQTNT